MVGTDCEDVRFGMKQRCNAATMELFADCLVDVSEVGIFLGLRIEGVDHFEMRCGGVEAVSIQDQVLVVADLCLKAGAKKINSCRYNLSRLYELDMLGKNKNKIKIITEIT